MVIGNNYTLCFSTGKACIITYTNMCRSVIYLLF